MRSGTRICGRESVVAGHVFISYSRHDNVYVQQLVAHLRGERIPAWADDAISYGDHWEDVICQQIDTCAVFVPVMTPAAWASQWVRNEVARARQRGKPILPLLLSGDIFFGLSHVEAEDVSAGGMPRPAFVSRLHTLLEPIASPIPTQLPGSTPAPAPQPTLAQPAQTRPAPTAAPVAYAPATTSIPTVPYPTPPANYVGVPQSAPPVQPATPAYGPAEHQAGPQSAAPSPGGSHSGAPSPGGSHSGAPSPAGSHSGAPYPAGSHSAAPSPTAPYPAVPPPAKRRTGRWIAVAVIAFLLVGSTLGAIFGSGADDNGGSGSDASSASGGSGGSDGSGANNAAPVVEHVTTPQTIGNFTLSDQTPDPGEVSGAQGEVTDPTGSAAGIYLENGATDAGKAVLIVAATGTVADPAAEMNKIFAEAASGNVSNVHDVDPGQLSGSAKCGTQTDANNTYSVCAWADPGSVGAVVFVNRSLDESEPLFRDFRNAVLARD
jgi:TIR domain